MIHKYKNILTSNCMRVTMFYFAVRMPHITLFQYNLQKYINLKYKCVIIKL